MTQPPDTRDDLRRALVVNALTKPLNVLVPALVAVAASLLGASVLIAVSGGRVIVPQKYEPILRKTVSMSPVSPR